MKKTSIGIAVVSVLALVIAGLAYGYFSRRVSIERIHQDATAFHGRQVIVSGTVTRRLSINAFSMFWLDDGTGEIQVRVRHGSIPAKGTKVTVLGTVNNLFKVGETSLGTMVEEKQRW